MAVLVCGDAFSVALPTPARLAIASREMARPEAKTSAAVVIRCSRLRRASARRVAGGGAGEVAWGAVAFGVGGVGVGGAIRGPPPSTSGQFFTLQKALPLLNDGGSIVLTVGVGARRGTPGATVGAATRGALLAMLPSLALELAPRRIRVNAVSPGATDTSLFDKLGVGPAGRDGLRANIPWRRFGCPGRRDLRQRLGLGR